MSVSVERTGSLSGTWTRTRTRWRMEAETGLTPPRTGPPFRPHPVGQRTPRVGQVVDRTQIGAGLETGVPEGPDHLGVGLPVGKRQLADRSVGQARHIGQDAERAGV